MKQSLLLIGCILLFCRLDAQSFNQRIKLNGSKWTAVSVTSEQATSPELMVFSPTKGALINFNRPEEEIKFFEKPSATRFLGIARKEDQLMAIFSKNGNTKFYYQVFQNGIPFANARPFDVSQDKETFLASFSMKDKCYILTIKNRTSVMNIYSVDADLKVNKITQDFSKLKFFKDGFEKTLFSLLQDGKGGLKASLYANVVNLPNASFLQRTINNFKIYLILLYEVKFCSTYRYLSFFLDV